MSRIKNLSEKQAGLVNVNESDDHKFFTGQNRVEISKSEYDKIKKKHENANGRYFHNKPHVWKDKNTFGSQTGSHNEYGIPSIEAQTSTNSKGKLTKYFKFERK